MRAMKLSVMASICLLFVLAGCGEVPITGRTQLSLVPDTLITSMSVQEYQQFIAQSKVSADSKQSDLVGRVGTRIVQAVNEYCKTQCDTDPFAGYQWEFNLIEDKQINAFAMPGGKVVVYTGILPVTQNDAGLAAVVAHEIAHVFAKHGNERMTTGLIKQFGGVALSAALKNKPEETRNLFMGAYGLGTQIGVELPFSRYQENEADHLGMIFMAMAGYDPHEALSFWQRMAAQDTGQAKPPELLSTHPANETRIKKIQELMPEAMKYYKPAGPQGQIPTPGGTSQALAFPPIKK